MDLQKIINQIAAAAITFIAKVTNREPIEVLASFGDLDQEDLNRLAEVLEIE
jgi:hypothetical protein